MYKIYLYFYLANMYYVFKLIILRIKILKILITFLKSENIINYFLNNKYLFEVLPTQFMIMNYIILNKITKYKYQLNASIIYVNVSNENISHTSLYVFLFKVSTISLSFPLVSYYL